MIAGRLDLLAGIFAAALFGDDDAEYDPRDYEDYDGDDPTYDLA